MELKKMGATQEKILGKSNYYSSVYIIRTCMQR